MVDQQQIAQYVGSRLVVGRVRPGQNYWYASVNTTWYWGQMPTAEQVAAELIADAEFRALQLGGFLNTPAGEFIEQAVALVVPRALAPEFDLIVEALKLAAELQQGQLRGKTLLTIGGGLLVGLVLREIGRAA